MNAKVKPSGGKRGRLDLLLVARGLAESRERAQALILAGLVEVDGKRVSKAGEGVRSEARLLVTGPDHPYVGRGGVKLAGALDRFGIDPSGRIALDVGASTGGFTDCLLQRGAARVYSLDVGSGQLHDRLRRDPRVLVLDRLNARNLRPDALPGRVSLATVDVSFISLRLILPPVLALLDGTDAADLVPLVKPQFEVGRDDVGRGGIVRDPALQRGALEAVAAAAVAAGLAVRGACASPITGMEGNREFFLHLTPGEGGLDADARGRLFGGIVDVGHGPAGAD